MTLPVLDTGGGVAGGVADGGVVDEGVTTGADGCSKPANPGLIWTSRDMDGARLAMGRFDCAVAVNGTAAASLRDAVGAARLLREDIGSGLVAIGTIGAIVRLPTGAGVLFDGLSGPIWSAVVGMFPAEDNLALVLDEGPGSDARGVLTTAEAGFFVNLWWSVCEEGVVTAGAMAATGREGTTADSGRGTIGNAGASGRCIRLCCFGVAVSPARTGAANTIARSQMYVERVSVDLFV